MAKKGRGTHCHVTKVSRLKMPPVEHFQDREPIGMYDE